MPGTASARWRLAVWQRALGGDLAPDPGGQVLHQVADEDDATRDPFRAQVRDRRRRRGEEPVGQVVGDDPVDLLGHPSIEAAEASLDVGERNAELGRHECAGQGRVRVAVDQDDVGHRGSTIDSRPVSIAAVCSACEPPPTPRL